MRLVLPTYSYSSGILILFLSILSIVPLASGQTDCQLKKQKEDLKVYTCSAAESKLKVLKAEFIIEDTSFEELLEFLKNINNCVTWQYNTIEAAALQNHDGAIIYRTVIEAPWPVSNREMILELTSAFDSVKQELTIVSRSIDYEYPQTDDFVRVPFALGRWQVVSVQGSLRVVYTLRIDPGGSVPAWLINLSMAEGPYNSFSKLKEKLGQKRR
jgi:hypothetical protein